MASARPLRRFVLFHKPYGVLCQFSDSSGRQRSTLQDFIPVPDVYPVGRLDRDSEGLLLLTNDGFLQHRLSDPRHAHPRTYWAQVEGAPTSEALQPLLSGIDIQGYRTRPARVQILEKEPAVPPRDPPVRYRKSIPTAWLELTLTEGRNRQVRHMTAAVGFPTLRLIRIALGELRWDGLAPGEWRELTHSEAATLRRIASPEQVGTALRVGGHSPVPPRAKGRPSSGRDKA